MLVIYKVSLVNEILFLEMVYFREDNRRGRDVAVSGAVGSTSGAGDPAEDAHHQRRSGAEEHLSRGGTCGSQTDPGPERLLGLASVCLDSVQKVESLSAFYNHHIT